MGKGWMRECGLNGWGRWCACGDGDLRDLRQAVNLRVEGVEPDAAAGSG